ncbi:MAG: ribokinase [Sporichthyaceae bacterium]
MPQLSGVTALGSANLDLVLRLPDLPAAGQTLLAAPRATGPGGKGLNQAVAAARAGAGTRFVGAVGSDPEGAQLLQVLAAEGIEATVRTTAGRSGLAVVLVDAAGENAIVVDQGANAELVDLTPGELAAVASAQVLLLQLEVPMSTVTEAARAAHSAGTTVLLNAAPQAPLDAELCAALDLLVVNEGEARALAAGTRARRPGDDRSPEAPDDLDRELVRLLELVPAVLVTLGPAGALYRDRAGTRHHEPGRAADVVDTTGAGDSFAGYLAASLAAGLSVPRAMARANAAAALCVGRPGAVAAVPRGGEVDAASGP